MVHHTERLERLVAWHDDRGNEIVYDGEIETGIVIRFRGSGNRLVVASGARLGTLHVVFDCDDAVCELGPSRKGIASFSATIRLGQDAAVRIGQNVSTTNKVVMSAVEGTSITVGDDVMFASDVQLRGDDGHPIFDVRTGLRVNVAKSITIGNHVWLGRRAVVLGGASVGDGAVIGYGSIVTKKVPNNCIAAGVPAKVLRRDVAWERPHLSLKKPYYKPDASTIAKSPYWALTEGGAARPKGRFRRAMSELLGPR